VERSLKVKRCVREERRTLRNYFQLAGGFKEEPDMLQMYVYPDGCVTETAV
jgi:hypothetical protein